MASNELFPHNVADEPANHVEGSRANAPSESTLETAILLCVRVTPADARVYLDDRLVSIGHFRGFVEKSCRYRTIRVIAASHVPWMEAFVPVCDTTIAVVLARHSRQTPPPPRPVRVILHEPDEPPKSEPPSSTDPLAATGIW